MRINPIQSSYFKANLLMHKDLKSAISAKTYSKIEEIVNSANNSENQDVIWGLAKGYMGCLAAKDIDKITGAYIETELERPFEYGHRAIFLLRDKGIDFESEDDKQTWEDCLIRTTEEFADKYLK